MPPARRQSDLPTVAEVERRLDRHEVRSAEVHRDLIALLRRLDERTDHLATRITVIFSVVAVLWAIFLVIAPVIRQWLGIP